MTSAVARIIFVVFLPLILGRIIALLKFILNWKRYCSFFRKLSRVDLASISAAVLWCLFLYVDGFHKPSLYFAKTGTSLDAPSYMIRNRFRDYTMHLKSSNPRFESLYTKYVKHPDSPIDNEIDPLLKQFLDLDELSNKLRSSEYRKNYIFYGQAADCEICERNHWFFNLYILPGIASTYIGTIIIIGILTLGDRKQRFRLPSILLVFMFLLYETYVWVLGDSFVIEAYAAVNAKTFLARPEQLSRLRSAWLIIVVILSIFFDLPRKVDPIMEGVLFALKSVELAFTKRLVARLVKIAIYTDSQLRSQAASKAESRRGSFPAFDSEGKLMIVDLLKRYNAEMILKSTISK